MSSPHDDKNKHINHLMDEPLMPTPLIKNHKFKELSVSPLYQIVDENNDIIIFPDSSIRQHSIVLDSRLNRPENKAKKLKVFSNDPVDQSDAKNSAYHMSNQDILTRDNLASDMNQLLTADSPQALDSILNFSPTFQNEIELQEYRALQRKEIKAKKRLRQLELNQLSLNVEKLFEQTGLPTKSENFPSKKKSKVKQKSVSSVHWSEKLVQEHILLPQAELQESMSPPKIEFQQQTARIGSKIIMPKTNSPRNEVKSLNKMLPANVDKSKLIMPSNSEQMKANKSTKKKNQQLDPAMMMKVDSVFQDINTGIQSGDIRKRAKILAEPQTSGSKVRVRSSETRPKGVPSGVMMMQATKTVSKINPSKSLPKLKASKVLFTEQAGESTSRAHIPKSMQDANSYTKLPAAKSMFYAQTPKSGSIMKSTKSRSIMKSTKSGSNMKSTKSGSNVTSTKSGSNVTSTKSGSNVTSTKSGSNMKSTKSGSNVTSTKSASKMNSTRSERKLQDIKSGAKFQAGKTITNIQGKSDLKIQPTKYEDSFQQTKSISNILVQKCASSRCKQPSKSLTGVSLWNSVMDQSPNIKPVLTSKTSRGLSKTSSNSKPKLTNPVELAVKKLVPNGSKILKSVKEYDNFMKLKDSLDQSLGNGFTKLRPNQEASLTPGKNLNSPSTAGDAAKFHVLGIAPDYISQTFKKFGAGKNYRTVRKCKSFQGDWKPQFPKLEICNVFPGTEEWDLYWLKFNSQINEYNQTIENFNNEKDKIFQHDLKEYSKELQLRLDESNMDTNAFKQQMGVLQPVPTSLNCHPLDKGILYINGYVIKCAGARIPGVTISSVGLSGFRLEIDLNDLDIDPRLMSLGTELNLMTLTVPVDSSSSKMRIIQIGVPSRVKVEDLILSDHSSSKGADGRVKNVLAIEGK